MWIPLCVAWVIMDIDKARARKKLVDTLKKLAQDRARWG
jgi:hypothetical protein